MNNWQEDLLKTEKAEFDKNQANKRSIELHTKFILQLSKEHYLIRKSINSTTKPKLISKTELLEILLADERTKSLFKIIPPTRESLWRSNIICKSESIISINEKGISEFEFKNAKTHIKATCVKY